ncbi:lysosomal alpha-glucosidase-like [Oratosquilla oratoria]|uniref:lysosomal alpha-glucosidase-like n=1 Tax=Oratosquilla oratoria TaxID=337810 RepID=UPI003F76A771
MVKIQLPHKDLKQEPLISSLVLHDVQWHHKKKKEQVSTLWWKSLLFIAVFIVALILIMPLFFWGACTSMLQHLNLHIQDVTQSYKVPEKNDYNCDEKILPNCEKHEKIELKPPHLEDPTMCLDIPLELRFDCHPENEVSQQSCEAKGCCWKEVVPEMKKLHKNNSSIPLSIPYCFYPRDYVGYKFKNLTTNANGLSGFLQREVSSGFPNDIPVIKMDFIFETEERLRIRVTDPTQNRWEVPLPTEPKFPSLKDTKMMYSIEITKSSGSFRVLRRSSGVRIFDTQEAAPLVFADQFLQLSSFLSSDFIYGLGEHLNGLLLDMYWKRHILWNLDHIPEEGPNLYGSHPFYMALEPDGNAHGVFLLNSNALDVVLQPSPALTFHVTGGILDLYIFLGPTPGDVIRQYTDVIGRPFLPPYWSLGYHQCRYEYGTLEKTKEVWKRTREADIPFDVQWNDLDYMDDAKDFTFDHHKFAGLPEFVEELHKNGMHYVPIIDPGISAAETAGSYPPWDDGVTLGVFVKNSSGDPFIGKVWNPIATTWPDFTHPNVTQYWFKQLQHYHSQVPIDGAWIDMNEPSNFWSGEKEGCPNNSYENPPYIPPVHGGKLYYHTICMSANQSASIHYNVHNLYGLSETIATHKALVKIRQKRPFIISRSTFPGQGHYGGHWTGDVLSDWYNMWKSIAGILNFNMFGIPMVGADICGFNGNTTVNLCERWMELGAFYPFSRNHNTDDGIDQDPVALGERVTNSSRKALVQRYTLLPFLYTLFFKAHLLGETVARPLFFQFPMDSKTYGIDTQFLWGSGLMIAPALLQHQTKVNAYLPKGLWYDWYTGEQLKSKGEVFKLDAPHDTIPLLVRGGSVLPTQDPSTTTVKSRLNKFGLVIAPDDSGNAAGELYWDDGDSLDTVERKEYNHIEFECGSNSLISKRTSIDGAFYPAKMELGSMRILGVLEKVQEVAIDGKLVPFSYNSQYQVLHVKGFTQNLMDKFTVTWK